MSHVIILAENTAAGNAYVREHRSDLPRGRYIVPTSIAQIQGVLPHLVIELPGFAMRRDRHAILAAVKRSSKKYQACQWMLVEDEDPRGDLTERQLEVAYRYHSLRDLPTATPLSRADAMAAMADDLPDDDAGIPAPPTPVRRRSKCKTCLATHYAGDPCPPDPFASF